MLAAFDKSVAKSPEGLRADAAGNDGLVSALDHFSSTKEGVVTVNLGAPGVLAYSSETKKNPLIPRLFGVVDEIFCFFQGRIENIPQLKQQYGLSKSADEVIIIIEAYKSLRDRGPFPADQVVRGLDGKFVFVLFDGSCKAVFVAADSDGSVPFYWGTDSENRLIFSDDMEFMKKGCGKSFASFPKGCFFTSTKGLQSFEHPLSEMKAMPRVDSQGEVCGANFKVDVNAKKDTSMPRVGSAVDWSSHY